MMSRLDEKGKLYTERVRKIRVEVAIVTTQGDVVGFVHVTHDQRVRDLLNNSEELFLAVTDATLRGYGSPNQQQVDFIAINKHHIVSLIPVDEDKIRRQQVEEYYIPQS